MPGNRVGADGSTRPGYGRRVPVPHLPSVRSAGTGGRAGAVADPDPRWSTGAVQWCLTAGVIGLAALTVRPIGTSGTALVVAVLLPVTSVLLVLRHLRAPGVPDRVAAAVLVLAVVTALVLTALSEDGTAAIFAYFLVGHAGLRLEPRWSVPVAAVGSGLGAVLAVLAADPGGRATAAVTGLTVGLPVVVGITDRTQRAAALTQLAAARSAERAARAEAHSAVLTERARIARDVHDVLAHSLAGVNMQLELADALLETGDLERVRQANERAHALVRSSLQQAQWTVHALREDTLPLTASLVAMLESSGHREALRVTGPDPGAAAIAPAVVQNLLRITQESLTNAGRHAPGAALWVEVHHDPGRVTLTVRNGPSPRSASPGAARAAGSGMGLVGMRERTALLSGTLQAGPLTEGPLAGGWQVVAQVPVQPPTQPTPPPTQPTQPPTQLSTQPPAPVGRRKTGTDHGN